MIDFVILGAQKAATSALQAALRQHPEIYMPAGESAFFEDPDFADQPWLRFGDDHPDARLKGIKRPDNLCSDVSIARIADALPDARFIVVLREPVSRAVSSYCYLVRHAQLPALPLGDGIARCIDAFEAGQEDRAGSIVQFGLYGAYLAKWFEKFGAERFLILSQDRMRKDAEGALTESAAHLGVDPAPLIAALKGGGISDSNTGLYDPAMLRIARVGSLLKTRAVPGTLRRVPRSLPPRALGTLITRGAEILADRRGQRRETLPAPVAARLQAHFDNDLETLRGLVPDFLPRHVLYWDAA